MTIGGELSLAVVEEDKKKMSATPLSKGVVSLFENWSEKHE